MSKKYKHPNLETVVPVKERLRVYKEAKKYLESERTNRFNDDKSKILKDFGLCLLFPCLLWNLDSFLSLNPVTKEYWSYTNTTYAFPEFTFEDIDEITMMRDEYDRDEVRLQVVKKAIKKANKILKQEKLTKL